MRSVECEVRSVKCVKSDEKARLLLHCDVIAQVMLLDSNRATASHKARAHGLGGARRMQVL